MLIRLRTGLYQDGLEPVMGSNVMLRDSRWRLVALAPAISHRITVCDQTATPNVGGAAFPVGGSSSKQTFKHKFKKTHIKILP